MSNDVSLFADDEMLASLNGCLHELLGAAGKCA
jgi:hypothetical protein